MLAFSCPHDTCVCPFFTLQAVLYSWNHFSLLCTVEKEGPANPPLLPLCTRGGPLLVRFPSEAEEQQLLLNSIGDGAGNGDSSNSNSSGGGSVDGSGGGPSRSSSGLGGSCSGSGSVDQQLVLLRRYMDAERLFNGQLGVRLAGAWVWLVVLTGAWVWLVA